MKIFITVSFGESREKIEQLCSLVKSAGFEDFCFIRDVEKYQKIFDNPKQLMQKSKEEIQKSDALLIDMSEKPTGRAIEAGIAYALSKKVIVIMKKGTQIKDTTRGIADEIIEYDNITEILPKLKQVFIKWRNLAA